MFMDRPKQAVILAGGRGSRLGPFTETRPKPMVEVHGRPFLEYLVEMLREQGFSEVLLLLGYLPHVVQDHFGDGGRFGVRITYSVTAPEDLTTRRLLVAREQLDSVFLLMYCDNYWPMQFDRLWEQYVSSGAPALTTVYSNKDRYSRDSVKVGADGFMEIFDRSRTTPGLQGVEISYAIAATGGTPQSAGISAGFTTALQATVTESGVPAPGIPVTFNAPNSGPQWRIWRTAINYSNLGG